MAKRNATTWVAVWVLLLLPSISAEECTYYHPDLIGELMANGMPYDAHAFTAAHGSIYEQPFQYELGVILQVEHDDNIVLVEVTDRHGGLTDIDLSFQAFSDLIDDLDGEGRIIVIVKECEQ